MRAYPVAGSLWAARRARRLLFVRPERKVRMAPLYMAILLLVSLSVIGFAAALWRQEPAHPQYRSEGGRPTSAGGLSDRAAAPSVGRSPGGEPLALDVVAATARGVYPWLAARRWRLPNSSAYCLVNSAPRKNICAE